MRLQAFIGNDKLTVKVFNAKLEKLSKPKQKALLRNTLLLSVGYWKELPPEYKHFLYLLIKKRRQDWLDIVLADTILGGLRYELQRPKLLFFMLKILELTVRLHKVSINHLSMSCLLAFRYNYKISTFGDYTQRAQPATRDMLIFSGKLVLEDDYYGV